MDYIKNINKPSLEIKNVISILISADFLVMKHLVERCIEFMAGSLNDVVRLPIDMSCMNDRLLSLLTSKVPIDLLANIKDKRDKLESRLYQRKVESLLTSRAKKLLLCSQCKKLYTEEMVTRAICYEAKVFVDFRGEI